MRLIIRFSRKMALRLSDFNYKLKKSMEDPCPVMFRVAPGHYLSLKNVVTDFYFLQ